MRASLFAPASTAWLLGHELRLVIRALRARQGGIVTLLVVGTGLLAGTAFGGVPLGLWLRHTGIPLTGAVILGFDGGLLAIFTLILSQTLSAAVTAFYERGDLDLLLASPVPPERVLAVRAASVALTPFLWFALFLTPILLPLAVLQRPSWLWAYLVLACLALLASALGLGLAMMLFSLIGARATKTVGQLVAALVGALFFLVSQLRSLLPDKGAALGEGFLALTRSRALDPAAPLAWPARAALGEPGPLFVLVLASLGAYGALSSGLGRRFARDASLAAGAAGSRSRRRPRAARAADFARGPFPALLIKELRLLVRDPILLSQVLLRTLYVVPMTFLLARSAGGGGALQGDPGRLFTLSAGAGAVVFMAGQVAGSLAWIAISAEDSPELLACAPVDGGLIRRVKLLATLIPVAALLAVPLGLLTAMRPWIGVCAALGAAAAAISSGLVNLWFEKPAERKAFRSRRGGSVIGASSELILGMAWAVTTAMAASYALAALIGLFVSLCLLAGLRALARPDRRY